MKRSQCFNSPHEGGVGHLGRVALDDQLAHPVHVKAIGGQDDVDPGDHSRIPQRPEIGVAHQPAVELRPRRLTLRDRVGQRRVSHRPAFQGDGHAAAIRGREADRPPVAGGARGQRQVLGGASEGDVEVMVVRIDDGGPSREVGQDLDLVLSDPESPRLRIVPARRERRHTNDLGDRRPGRKRRTLARHGGVVFRHRAHAPR
ncbi:hypothetical protein [Lichenifustis flavocetrariae]|uniref:hypothetical protein n=1 Tax=Lichenifustis flavocetrariae TaxID=2949735 RepID=UPI0031F59CAB